MTMALDDGTLLTARSDGARLGWLRHGTEGGKPVVGLHGMPGGRHAAVPDPETLAELEVDYVTFDRPGYGASTRRPGRTVASIAEDVLAVADAASLESFSVVGGSGGSAHALAVAALAPERVRAVTLIVPTAPRVGNPAMGDEAWFVGMDEQMAALHRFAAEGEPSVRAALIAMMGEADDVVDGLVDDLVSIHRDWGFDLRKVACPVGIWYGTDDVNAPPAHALWLADHLTAATLRLQAGDHTWPSTRKHEIFAAIADQSRRTIE